MVRARARVRLPVGGARRYLGGRSQGLLHACPLVGDVGRCARDELGVQYEGREVRAGEDARRREGATQGEHARDQDRVERAWAGLGLGLGLGLRVGVEGLGLGLGVGGGTLEASSVWGAPLTTRTPP